MGRHGLFWSGALAVSVLALAPSADAQPQPKPPAAQPAPAKDDGFKEAGFFALRVDAAGRPRGPNGPIEVALTARNYKGGRQGIQYNDNAIILVGSNGAEYKSDGNFYGRSSQDRLNGTAWLEKDEQASVTYVYPGPPRGVVPARLIVRDRDRVIAEFPLKGLPAQRGVKAGPVSEDGTPAGEVVSLPSYEAKLISINRGVDGDWEAVAAFKNTTSSPLVLDFATVGVALFDATGETRYATGSFYQPEPGRRMIGASVHAPPDEEIRVRVWFPETRRLAPKRYKLQEARGEGKSGPIPESMLAPPLP